MGRDRAQTVAAPMEVQQRGVVPRSWDGNPLTSHAVQARRRDPSAGRWLDDGGEPLEPSARLIDRGYALALTVAQHVDDAFDVRPGHPNGVRLLQARRQARSGRR